MGVIYDLCFTNKFYALHLNVSRNVHVMSLPDQMRFVHNMTTWRQKLPAVYHGHLAYVDFERLGVRKRPLYINIVRKPLDRLVSYYYFLRFGDTFRPHLRRMKQGDKEVRKIVDEIISQTAYISIVLQPANSWFARYASKKYNCQEIEIL